MTEILERAKRVAVRGLHVKIDETALGRFTGNWLAEGWEPPPWEAVYHFQGGEEETLFYLLILDSLNFCFWPPPGEEKWAVSHESGWLSGYYALALSLKRAVESGIPLTDPGYLKALSSAQLGEILRGRGELQLMEPRLQILHELGEIIESRYDGSVSKLLAAAGRSAQGLVRLLAETFLSFRDVAEFEGFKVPFYKRAQILAADLHGTFGGEGWGGFRDMENLTAFADYKLPQVLRHLGIFRYSESLARKVDQMIHLEAGGVEEVELRANTIWAVELIRRELARRGMDLRAFEIDWVLWDMGQEEAFKEKPYHRTVTIYY
ncbi:MAG: queuosine salvage family protein [Proteobacteria bacterium]|nr:queuosine salvage family protein [Pseudomonadota bacterium]